MVTTHDKQQGPQSLKVIGNATIQIITHDFLIASEGNFVAIVLSFNRYSEILLKSQRKPKCFLRKPKDVPKENM